MANDEKKLDLESRIEKLERIEKRRSIINAIVLSLYGVVLITIIVYLIVFNNRLKPYKNKIDNLKGESKVDNIVDGNDGFDSFEGYPDYFNDYDDFWNGFFGF